MDAHAVGARRARHVESTFLPWFDRLARTATSSQALGGRSAMRQSSTNNRKGRATKVFLVVTDGSEGGTAALRKAADFAATENAELVVLAVMPRDIESRTMAGEARNYARAEHLAGGVVEAGSFVAENILEEAKAIVEGRHDVKASYISRAGVPAEEIVACARERSADMLFVGSRGRGPLGAFFQGSVSRRVADLAPCTVEIVATPE